MNSLKKPETLITLINTAALLGASIYFYKKTNNLELELNKHSEHLTLTVKKVKEIVNTKKHIAALADAIKKLNHSLGVHNNDIESLKEIVRFQNSQIIEMQTFILSLRNEENKNEFKLKENPHIQSILYQQGFYPQNGFNQQGVYLQQGQQGFPQAMNQGQQGFPQAMNQGLNQGLNQAQQGFPQSMNQPQQGLNQQGFPQQGMIQGQQGFPQPLNQGQIQQGFPQNMNQGQYQQGFNQPRGQQGFPQSMNQGMNQVQQGFPSQRGDSLIDLGTRQQSFSPQLRQNQGYPESLNYDSIDDEDAAISAVRRARQQNNEPLNEYF